MNEVHPEGLTLTEASSVAGFLYRLARAVGVVRLGLRNKFKKSSIKRYKRLLLSMIDRLWRRLSGKDDLLYFCVLYKSRDAKREYEDFGVLSGQTIGEAARKADLARKVFEWPGWEEFCEYKCMVPISIRGYRLMKKSVIDIDSLFDKKGKLLV